MSFKGSSAWKAAAFDAERTENSRFNERVNNVRPSLVKRDDGWILFGPQDIRDGKRRYNFALQQLKCDKQIRVRVGCRYFTLPQAWKHWSKAAKSNYSSLRRNEGKQALAIITLMILQAQAHGLLSRFATIKFDSSICKRKRK